MLVWRCRFALASEEALLGRYAPTVAAAAPQGPLLLHRLAAAFADLRDLHTPNPSSGRTGKRIHRRCWACFELPCVPKRASL